jgi:hypothetical protein
MDDVLGDLYKNNSSATNVVRYFQGRDAFYILERGADRNKPYNRRLGTHRGKRRQLGQRRRQLGCQRNSADGPGEGHNDGQAVNAARCFSRHQRVDCFDCHDGRTIGQ